MHHPIQPLETDKNGITRFKPNQIVQHLINNGSIGLEQIARLEFPQNDREQFAQLIGNSLSGFGDLPYVSSETYEAAVSQQNPSPLDTSAKHYFKVYDSRIVTIESQTDLDQDGWIRCSPETFAQLEWA